MNYIKYIPISDKGTQWTLLMLKKLKLKMLDLMQKELKDKEPKNRGAMQEMKAQEIIIKDKILDIWEEIQEK